MKKLILACAAVFFIFGLMCLIPFIMLIVTSDNSDSFGDAQGMNLSEEVLAYRPQIEQYAARYGISGYVPYLLAIMQVESGGRGKDVMQSSESLGLPPDTLETDASIEQGVLYFASCIRQAERQGCDLKSAIQGYNYGSGFINYVARNTDDGKYTFELAVEYARIKSGGETIAYPDELAVQYNGGWRYKYGSMFYVPHVMQYIITNEFDDETVQKIFDEALKYQGWRYVWGGSNPQSGFDCSGLTSWCFKQAGISIPRTAQAQYNAVQHISAEDAQPGDLVFFSGTYETSSYITHVGIYAGNGRMYHAGDPIGYADINTEYWQAHFAGFGRAKK
ncbi:MAG: bifunctional lysozyme/C40 family peptidase [Lachnospiraceae bacterium]|nr:bifunctional lysozyme/C40 family peptidase [Lachnospiraceae bacterium]